MKTELIEFLENDLGFPIPLVKKSIRKYFRGKEVKWHNKYVHEIDTMYGENCEVIMQGDFGTIVFNADNLFLWLPVIVAITKKQRDEQTKITNDILRGE
jgi:hypothetical protein